MLERQPLGPYDFDALCFRIDWLVGVFLRYSQMRPGNGAFSTVLQTLQLAKLQIKDLNNDIYQGYLPKKLFSGCRGRPSFQIPKQQLEMFLEYKFTVRQISEMLGVSMSIVNRRLVEYELLTSQTYSTLTDEHLDQVTEEIITEFPNSGYRRMTGYLRARGIYVQQHRIRESMRRSDPEGVLLRALQLTPCMRRTYSVAYIWYTGKFGQTKGKFCHKWQHLWLLAHPIKFGQFYKNSIFG